MPTYLLPVTGVCLTAIMSGMLMLGLNARDKVIKATRCKPPYSVSGPKVSVIIPTLNEEYYLPNCLKSIKNQTYENIEIIVADSHSKDKTSKIAKDFGAKIYQFPKSIPIARNGGAKKSKGEILLFLDADCIIEHRYVEKMVDALSEMVRLVHGGTTIYDSNLHGFVWTIRRFFKPFYYTEGRGICIKKDDFWKIDGYDPKLDPIKGFREDLNLGKKVLMEFGPLSIRYRPNVLVGTSVRREKVFGYPLLSFPKSGWKARGVRNGKPIY